MPGYTVAATFQIFYYMFTRRSSRGCDVNDAIMTLGAREGQYGCSQGLILVHARANMGSRERAVMCLKSRSVSAQVTKYFVTIFSKHVIKDNTSSFFIRSSMILHL